MESQNLNQLSEMTLALPLPPPPRIRIKTTKKSSKQVRKRMAMAKHSLRSLAIAVSFLLSLSLLNIYLFGSGHSYGTLAKPFCFPPLWLIHITCMASSFVMGLSAWLVWAEDGFHERPTAFSLYLDQLGLSLAWLPIALWMGASWVGVGCVFGVVWCSGWVFKGFQRGESDSWWLG